MKHDLKNTTQKVQTTQKAQTNKDDVKLYSKWMTPVLDLTRDRKTSCIPKTVCKKHGGERQKAQDIKRERLQLQFGEISDNCFPSIEALHVLLPREYSSMYSLNTLENLLLFAHDIYYAEHTSQFLSAAYHFVKHSNPSVNLVVVFKKIQDIMATELQDSGFVTSIHDLRSDLQTWMRFRTSPFMAKIGHLLAYCTAVGIYRIPEGQSQSEDVKKLIASYNSTNLEFCGDFIYYTLDFILFILEKGEAVFTNGVTSLRDIFKSSDEIELWIETSQTLISQSDYMSNPEAFGMDLHAYITSVSNCISKGDELVKYSCDVSKRTKYELQKLVGQLKRVDAQMIATISAQALRKVPFAICIEGHTSVGKSIFALILHMTYAKWFEKPVTGLERFVVNATAKFWDGYTSDKWSMLIDDASMFSAKSGVVDESVLNIIRIVNNIPFMPDMASLEDKGKTPCKVDLVVVTTNTPDLGMHTYFSYPLAAARRIPFHIRLEPKDSCVKDKFMMDTTKIDQTPFADNWLITVLVPKPAEKMPDTKEHSSQNFKFVVYEGMHRVDLKTFLLFYYKVTHEHVDNQNRVVRIPTGLKDAEYCNVCHLPTNVCGCNLASEVSPEFQSGEIIDCLFCFRCLYDLFVFFIDYVISFLFSCIITHCIARPMHNYMSQRCALYRNRVHQSVMDNIRRVYKGKETAVHVLGCLWLLFLLKHLYTKAHPPEKVEYQGSGLSKIGSPPNVPPERESSWIKKDVELTTFEVSRQSRSAKALTLQESITLLTKNSAFLLIHRPGTDVWITCHIIALRGTIFMTTAHSFPDQESYECKFVKGRETQLFILNRADMTFGDGDLMLFRIRCTTPRADITKYLTGSGLKDTHRGPAHYLGIDSNSENCYKFVPYTSCVKQYDNTVISERYDVWYSPGIAMEKGDCGLLLFTLNDLGLVLLGLHNFLVRGEGCGALALTVDLIKRRMSAFEDTVVPSPPYVSSNDEIVITPIKANSVLTDIQGGTLRVYGNISRTSRPRSKVKKTLLCEDMMKLGIPLNFGRPTMDARTPWRINLEKQICADSSVDGKILQIVSDQMFNDWCEQLAPGFEKELHVYDLHTAVNGKPGVRYVDSINRSSSTGFPWNTTKRKFVVNLPPDELYQDPVTFTDEILDRVEDRIKMYRKGMRTAPVFRASLKDEALPHKKVAAKKTRVFMAAPVDFTLVMRMFFLSFVRLAQMNPFVFEAAPGLEAQSVEWHNLREYLTGFGTDRMIFGDFSGFDITMRAEFLIEAFNLIYRLLEYAGYSDEDLRAVRAISYDVTFPFVEFNGDLVEFFGKNPAGHALTVTINSLVDVLYMRYCYYQLNPKKEVATFRLYVRLTTYGDDNGMGVSDKCPWFNHTSITHAMAKIGVTYTMADKVSASKEYIHIDDADFLKRKWRFEPELGKYVCPLDLNSIYKSLMIGTKSSSITAEDHAHCIIRTANSEFFWHGKEVFDFWVIRLTKFIDDHNLGEFFKDTPLENWDDLKDRYRKNSSLVLQDGYVFVRPNLTDFCRICFTPKEESQVLITRCLSCRRFDRCMFCGVRSVVHAWNGIEHFQCCASCAVDINHMADQYGLRGHINLSPGALQQSSIRFSENLYSLVVYEYPEG